MRCIDVADCACGEKHARAASQPRRKRRRDKRHRGIKLFLPRIKRGVESRATVCGIYIYNGVARAEEKCRRGSGREINGPSASHPRSEEDARDPEEGEQKPINNLWFISEIRRGLGKERLN